MIEGSERGSVYWTENPANNNREGNGVFQKRGASVDHKKGAERLWISLYLWYGNLS